MKKGIIVILAAVTALPLFASNGDTLNIGGVVPLILNLTVTPAANYDNLDLVDAAAGSVTATLAGIVIATNNSAGWELWITSTNADGGSCALINDDGDEVTYTLAYTGTGGAATTAVVATTGTMYGEAISTDTAERYDDTGNLTITYTQGADYPSGYYSDQLTIVLRAK